MNDVTSKFTFRKAGPHMESGFVREVRRSTRNGRTITELRSYYWKPELQMFQEIEEAQ